jgi:hypothetical protein
MIRLLLLLLVGMTILSCNKDEKGDLVLRFKLKYGEDSLRMFETYSYPVTGEDLTFTKVAFYISDIQVTNGQKSTDLKDIDFIDFTTSHTAPAATNGLEYRIRNVDAGSYSALSFGIGVPASLNSKEPKDFPSSNVLSNPAEYWTAWKSYIFMRNEGRIDLDNDGAMEAPFALHIGGDTSFIPIMLNKNFSIDDKATTSLDITIDMEKLFNGKSLYDIRAARQIHSLSQMPFILQLSENIRTGIK